MARWDRERRRDFLVAVVGRPLLFAFWSVVFWGTFYAVALLHGAATDGPLEAFRRVLSGRDQLAGYLNLLLTALAAVVWGFVAVALWRGRRERRRRIRHNA